ncbi:MAG: beta-aspartyl-peptidase [Bacillota bacterium]|nr:beta-aspartyl-peptidase [Bacillota bacterium]
MFKLLRGGKVYSPEFLGYTDIFIAMGKIINIRENIKVDNLFDVEIIDCREKIIAPGIIDQHLHILGGGGEGGPASRIPEVFLGDLIYAGITTVVGVLGFDGLTRSIAGLLTKAKALQTEGINTLIYTGSYGIPTSTLTGSVTKDIAFIDKVIGAGEIAISDYRSSHPDIRELKQLASEVMVGSMIGKKAGILHIHVGDGKEGLKPVTDLINESEFPIEMFVPTHINRNKDLFEEGLEFLKIGGNIDLTAGDIGDKGYNAPEALAIIKERNLSLDRVTITSDGNGSIPCKNGEFGVGKPSMLFDDIKTSISEERLSFEDVFKTVTINVAKLLKLYPQKGTLQEGSDADILILEEAGLNVSSLLINGETFIKEGKQVKRGRYEA